MVTTKNDFYLRLAVAAGWLGLGLAHMTRSMPTTGAGNMERAGPQPGLGAGITIRRQKLESKAGPGC